MHYTGFVHKDVFGGRESEFKNSRSVEFSNFKGMAFKILKSSQIVVHVCLNFMQELPQYRDCYEIINEFNLQFK